MIQHQLHQQHNHIDRYCDTVFTAISEQQSLEDVQAATLKGEFTDQVEQLAMSNLIKARKTLSPKSMAAEIDRLFKTNTIRVQESVTISRDGVCVIVDAPSLVDDNTIMRIFDLISKALDQLDGHYGTVSFGEPVSFTKQEIPWLTLH